MPDLSAILPDDLTAPNLAAMFALSCKWKGAAELICDAHDRYTAPEALETVARLAGGLQARGIGKGAKVAFLCGSSARHAIAFFACQWLGAVAVALHARELPARLAKTVGWLEADALVFDDDLAESAGAIVQAAGRPLVRVNFGDSRAGGADACFAELAAAPPVPMAQIGPEDPCVIILSSGTTGDPKGIVHVHRTLFAASRMGPYVYGPIQSGDALIVVMAPSFAAWVITVLPHLAARTRIVFGRAFDPEAFLQTLQDEKITMAPLVPTMFRMVIQAGPEKYDLGNLRSAFYSGEPGSPDLVKSIAERLTEGVRTGYMASESTCASCIGAGPLTLLKRGKARSTGRPVPGADLRIVDPAGGVEDVLPRGETGEILVKSPSVAAGYWKDPERTAQRFVDGWWRSGDLGMLDEDGDLFIVGRTDNVINTGGIKVHAEEVEAALTQHPAVAMAAVVGAPDENWGQRIEAHVVLSDPKATAEEIIAFCAEKKLLPRNKLPKRVVPHDTLPTGPTGKLYRRGLLESAD